MSGRMRRALVVAVLVLGGCGISALAPRPGSASTSHLAIGRFQPTAVRANTSAPDGLVEGERVMLAAHSWTHA
jgi:hypothetical protein